MATGLSLSLMVLAVRDIAVKDDYRIPHEADLNSTLRAMHLYRFDLLTVAILKETYLSWS